MAHSKTKLALAVVAVVSAGWFVSKRFSSTQPTRQAVELVGPVFHTGDMHRYALELHSEVKATHGSLVGYVVRGTWVLSVLEASAQGSTLSARLEDVRISVNGAASETGDPAQVTQARNEFNQETQFAFDARGVMKAVADQPDIELQVRSMMRAIAACFQVVEARPRPATWLVEERDGVGAYTARYTRASQTELRKTKLRYTQLSPQALAALGGRGELVVESSAIDLGLRQDRLPEHVSVNEVLRAAGSGLGGLSSKTQIQLHYTRTEHLSNQTLLTSVRPQTALNEYALRDGFSPATDRLRIAGRGVADFIAELEALPENKNEAQRARMQHAFSGLAALLRREPSAVDQTLSAIETHPQLANLLWDAMGSAGSPAAQAGLRKLIASREWSETQRLTQMIDLSLVASPTRETVDFLRGMLNDPEQRPQATYGLGTAAHNLAQTEPARATVIVHELMTRLDRAPGIASRVELLHALGNSGHRDAFQQIAAALEHRDLQVRIVALDALRFIEADEVDGLIIGALRRDPEESVRFAATSAAGWRPASDALTRALVDAWKQDRSVDVQHGARAALTRMDQRSPGVLAQLKDTDGF